eukprot:gene9209-3501_t
MDRDSPEPIVYVAVVDSVGNWVYRIPASQVEKVWPGIGRRTISDTVQAAPSRPAMMNPCTGGYGWSFKDPPPRCAVFTSNCQATNATAARAQGCRWNGEQGFCGNWFAALADTKQPLVPSDSCERDVRGGPWGPWCKEMVGAAAGWRNASAITPSHSMLPDYP